MESDSPARSQYRQEIDGLRAIAVLSVVAVHLSGSLCPGGFLGVDIFFVISGYVISQSVIASPKGFEGSNVASISRFLARRIRRLFPALVFSMTIAIVAISVVSITPKNSIITACSALFGLGNIALFLQSADYFADSTQTNIAMHTWSLGVEEQFYALFPLAYLLTRTEFAKQSKRRLGGIIVLLSFVSLFSFLALAESAPSLVFYVSPFRFWQIGFGIAVYCFGHEQTRAHDALMSNAGLCGVVACLIFAQPDQYFWHVAVTISTGVFLLAIPACSLSINLLRVRSLTYIGKISYSLYLWHWVIICVLAWTIGVDFSTGGIAFILMLGLSSISYHVIEEPFRRTRPSTIKTFLLFFALCAAVALFALALMKPLKGDLYIGNIFNVALPENLTTWWRSPTGNGKDKCHIPKGYSTSLIDECLTRESDTKPHSFLLGDSHARNYLFAVLQASQESRVRHLTVGNGCAFMPTVLQDYKSAKSVNCREYNLEVRQFLTNHLRPGDRIFLGQRLYQWDERRQTQVYFDFIEEFARELARKDVDLIVLDSVVFPEKHPRDCIAVPWKRSLGPLDSNCHRAREDVERALVRFDDALYQLSRRISNLTYAPLRLGLCDRLTCGQTTSSGIHIFHDRGHITDKAAQELAPLLRRHLASEKKTTK